MLEAAGLVLRLSTDDGVATGCEPLGDGSAVTAEGDPTGREDTLLVDDGEGLGVANRDGARLGRGWTAVWPREGAGTGRAGAAGW